MGIFNVRTTFGAVCQSYAPRGVRHKQVCTKVDSKGQKLNCPDKDRTHGLHICIPKL